MDQVEGLNTANDENWVVQFVGQALSFTVTGLTPTVHYRFKVLAMSEQSITSQFSEVSEYIATALPDTITFPATPFPTLQKSNILL